MRIWRVREGMATRRECRARIALWQKNVWFSEHEQGVEGVFNIRGGIDIPPLYGRFNLLSFNKSKNFCILSYKDLAFLRRL